jgi:hypothetical protein
MPARDLATTLRALSLYSLSLFVVLGMGHRALPMLGKGSATEPHSQPTTVIITVTFFSLLPKSILLLPARLPAKAYSRPPPPGSLPGVPPPFRMASMI